MAWAQWLYWRDRGPTEIGGFGISSPDDPLLITEIVLLPQSCTVTTVAFDDAAVADFFDAQVDAGRRPESFARIWLHTHPGDSAHPSGTDEETFSRVFGQCDWAIMGILARSGETYVRLRFNTGPGAAIQLAAEVDYTQPFDGSDWAAWDQQYRHCVRDCTPVPLRPNRPVETGLAASDIEPEPLFPAERWW